MNKLFGYLLSPIHYILFGLIICIFHPIQWICFKFGGQEAHKKSVDFMNFFIISTYFVLGSSVKFKNQYQLPDNRSIIFIANHQSLYDIPPLFWFLRRYHPKFISKIELTKGIPSVSFNLKYGGGANIDRKDRKQAIAEIIKMAERMKANNWSAVIFPEGTRSKDGQLKPFAIGGIATIAKKVPNALIVPIVIKNSWKFVQFGIFPLSFGEKMSWEILEPIEPKGKSIEDIIILAEEAIRKAL